MIRLSLQSLFIEMLFNEQVLSSGTAFVVQGATRPLLITNRHNFTGRHQDTDECLSPMGSVPNRVRVYHILDVPVVPANSAYYWGSRIEPIKDDDEKPLWFEHTVYGSKVDVVALPLTQLEQVKLFPHTLNEPNWLDFGPGDPISVIGFPFGKSSAAYLPIWVAGFLASEPFVDFEGLPVMLIDCRTRPGQSGSPVVKYVGVGGSFIDQNGVHRKGPYWRFLGVYSGRINKDSDLGRVWKLSVVEDLVQAIP